jgi:lipoprotein-releasing system permease protein
MYKFLLCWRYLLTRYLALACIISVMLGVATLIVVNSVMAGFSTKLKSRLHGLLADVIVESYLQDGMPDPDRQMERIRNSPIGKEVMAMSPTIEILGMVQISWHGEMLAPRAVRLIGVDPASLRRLSRARMLWPGTPCASRLCTFLRSFHSPRWEINHRRCSRTRNWM